MAMSENKQKMLRGELYFAFTDELIAARKRCEVACDRFNNAGDVSRAERVLLWRQITGDDTPLLPGATDVDVKDEPWIQPPIRIDYGTNLRVGPGAFVNFNCTVIDTCAVTIGARALVGPNVSFFAGAHPEDPDLRAGTAGPEYGAPVEVGDDAWIGGNVVVLPGVRIGRGAVVGAGSVVTKDVPDYWVAVGNPARLLREVRREKKQPPLPPDRGASPASSAVSDDVRDLPFGEALRRRAAAAARTPPPGDAVPPSREGSAPPPLHDESTGGVPLTPDLAEQ